MKFYFNNFAIIKSIISIEELKKLLKHLNCIPLKGSTLIHERIRPLQDIDILVKKKDLEKTILKLKEFGYKQIPSGEWNFFKKTTRTFLDLHTSIPYMDEYQLKELWNRTIVIRINDVQARILPPEENIIYTSFHAVVQHASLSKIWIDDIIYLIETSKSINWKELIKRARDYHLEIPLYIMLSEVDRSSPGIIPSSVISGFIPASFFGWLKYSIYRRLLVRESASEVSFLFLLLTPKGICSKIKSIFCFLFPSSEFIKRRYPPPYSNYPFLFYFLRPILIFSKALRLFHLILLDFFYKRVNVKKWKEHKK